MSDHKDAERIRNERAVLARQIPSSTAARPAMKAEECDHYYAWFSPAGARKSARVCMGCGWPDPEWLNHVTEVDRGHGPGCVHCEFALAPAPPVAEGKG
jgi:hypothetical protein